MCGNRKGSWWKWLVVIERVVDWNINILINSLMRVWWNKLPLKYVGMTLHWIVCKIHTSPNEYKWYYSCDIVLTYQYSTMIVAQEHVDNYSSFNMRVEVCYVWVTTSMCPCTDVVQQLPVSKPTFGLASNLSQIHGSFKNAIYNIL